MGILSIMTVVHQHVRLKGAVKAVHVTVTRFLWSTVHALQCAVMGLQWTMSNAMMAIHSTMTDVPQHVQQKAATSHASVTGTLSLVSVQHAQRFVVMALSLGVSSATTATVNPTTVVHPLVWLRHLATWTAHVRAGILHFWTVHVRLFVEMGWCKEFKLVMMAICWIQMDAVLIAQYNMLWVSLIK